MGGNPPVKSFRFGRIELAIWKQETDDGTRYSFTFNRRYKNKDGEWKSTAFFDKYDLASISWLCFTILLGEVKLVEKKKKKKKEKKKFKEEEPGGMKDVGRPEEDDDDDDDDDDLDDIEDE